MNTCTKLNIRKLSELAVTGLARMFSPSKQIFCYRLKQTEEGLVREGSSHIYTIMSLLGLCQLEAEGGNSPIDIKGILRSLLQDTSWIDGIGDLGLLIWLCALAWPECLGELYDRLHVRSALARFRDARQGRTMELAWFLSGLSHAELISGKKCPDEPELAFDTYHLLIANQGSNGVFGHLALSNSISGILRGRIGSFADQVYPMYALAKFGKAYDCDRALHAALKCAQAICSVQGPLGQWWWHYDAKTGRVAQRYPVYSVHQHGMGPMALFAVGEAVQFDCSSAISKGLHWITQQNELQTSMQDEAESVIWRSVQPASKLRMYAREVKEYLKHNTESATPDGLTILYECRPYELGWLLYGLSGKENELGREGRP